MGGNIRRDFKAERNAAFFLRLSIARAHTANAALTLFCRKHEFVLYLLVWLGLCLSCENRRVAPAGTGGASVGGVARPSDADVSRTKRPPRHNPDLLPAAGADVPAERRAVQISDGVEQIVDADLARQRGLTVVDLSDAWAPVIFADGTGPNGATLSNGYRSVFVGLANDRMDGDGQPTPPGEKNYLELFGIPPSLSVMGQRLTADAARDCRAVNNAALAAVDEITTWGSSTEAKELARGDSRAKRLDALKDHLGAASLEAAAGTDAKLLREVRAHRRFVAERAAFAEVEKRIACEGLLATSRHKAGHYDSVMRAAVLAFQQKHAVMSQGDLNRSTLEAMTISPWRLDFEALKRTLTERAVHSAGILEDGSATDGQGVAATYLGNDGQRHAVPDLVTAATTALLEALDWQAPEDAVDWFRRHTDSEFFRGLRIVARLPALPDYYAAGGEFEFSGEIDRGDIWYDFPFDARGDRLPQPRERFPSFALYVKWKGERVPLVRWRTTIGGWRSEVATDQQEYYAYKGSDVGPRVWRHLVAAPVWIPPASTPLGAMTKEKRVNGAFVKVTNYDETGPGYLSAYGLVAAIHEQMRKTADGSVFADNGIRTHGSFDYLSLRGRFSHGCHRLYNHSAVRLFSFVLAHHRARAIGSLPLNFRRTFWADRELYDMRLPNRGFYFELQPPIPIETLEGTIRGVRQTPVLGYVRKPGVRYATPSATLPEVSTAPESRAAAGGEP